MGLYVLGLKSLSLLGRRNRMSPETAEAVSVHAFLKRFRNYFLVLRVIHN